MCSILLVEDHADTRHILTMVLKGWGHSVSTAESVADGLALARLRHFDTIVSDIGLPDGSGCDFVQEIKHTTSERALKIAITAYTAEKDRMKAKLAGYHHFFDKPIDLQRLKTVLSTVL